MSETIDRTFPREIVYSPGYGEGLCTWAHGNGYDLIEHPVLIEYVKTTPPDKRDADEVEQLLTDAGFDAEGAYWGGLRQAKVTTVSGPYMIDEYDGSESVVEQANGDPWRT